MEVDMKSFGDYVYKKEVDWSLLNEGLTLPLENQVAFGRIMGRFLSRGESKEIKVYFNGKLFEAKIYNVNFSKKFNRKKDTLQIRFPKNGELSKEMQQVFAKSYKYILNKRKIRDSYDRSMIKLPDNIKEYLIIYTTEYDDSYIFDSIVADDIYAMKDIVKEKSEKAMEADFELNITDNDATIIEDRRIVKIRKLNKAIGNNLKLLYNYRCQICGQRVGDPYNSKVVEAHHIDYFVKSLNNNMSNIMIVCPNHHSIIHDVNPIFNKKRKIFIYKNGYEEGLKLNYHLNKIK